MILCLFPFLFLTGFQAATISKLGLRANLCDPLVLDCSDLLTTSGTSNLDLFPSSELSSSAATNLALSFNTDTNPGLQSLYGNGTPGPIENNDPLPNENTKLPQAFDTAINFGQGADDIFNVPKTEENEEISLKKDASWDPVYGGWWGWCHIYSIGCQMCYARAGDVPTTQLCLDAVPFGALGKYPGKYNLCLKDTTLPQTCIAHDPTTDDTPDRPAPPDWDPGEWGYCNEQGLQCAMCWKHETGESTGCVPAVLKILTSDTLPNPSTWLCFKGAKPSIHTCIKPHRWLQGPFLFSG
ncbi:hypothetical protein MMC29_000831 [Sticta canariensis]|nr:hypothetical protein [Sticta canariensis]